MKKTVIITAILLISLPAVTQRTVSERKRQETKSQSRATIRRPGQENQKKTSRTVQTERSPAGRQAREALRSSRTRDRSGAPEKQKIRKRADNSDRSANRNVNARSERTRNPGMDKENTGRAYRNPAGGQDRRSTSVTGQRRDDMYRKNYTPGARRKVRVQGHNAGYPNPVKFRSRVINYRAPIGPQVIWTWDMYRDYMLMYPDFHYWNFPIGYRIVTVPANRAYFHMGEVRNVYGRVHQVWYSRQTDEYYLYFGDNYPYQDFTVILAGKYARRFSRDPEWFLANRYLWVTGLVNNFNGMPEILVMRKSQVHLY